MSQLKIAIIGCGWLGLPLAKKLIKENFIVNGSTTSKEKISVLKTEKIEPFLIDLNKNLVFFEIHSQDLFHHGLLYLLH